MDAIIEGIFMFFFEALAEGFAELAASMTPQKNIKKKTRENIRIGLSMYGALSIILLFIGIVLLVDFTKYKVLGIIFICNFVLLLLASIVSNIVRKIRGKKNEKSS